MDAFQRFKRSPFIFPLACVAAAAMIFVSEGSYWQSVDAMNDIVERQAARVAIVDLAQSILDAESGQRGYLLTDRKEYLLPYEQATQRVGTAFQVLDRYYGQDPASSATLAKLHGLTDTKLSELALTIRTHEAGKVQMARELVLSNIGMEKMEAIRALGAELLALETRKLAASRDDLRQALLLSRVGVAALSAISLLGLYFYLRQASALRQRQLDLKRLAQTERERLETEVAQRTAQLTELTNHLQTAREDERNRLARNLHDDLGALLTSAKLDAARIKSRIAGAAPEALEPLAHLVGTLNSSITLGRRIIEDLRPSALVNLGLLPTLEILAREFTEQSGIEVSCALEAVQLEPSAELMVYRLVQEALTNISKYARASQVWLSVGVRDGRVEASVRDDGVGFDLTARPGSAYGLLGMRFRVQAEGGTLSVRSAPGAGTTLTARLALAGPATATDPPAG